MCYILATADACSDYALANILSLTQTAFQVICIAVPIILLISIIITIVSVVTNPDQKGIIKKIIIKIVAALVVFFLPMLVNILMSWLPDNEDGVNITSCWQKALETKSTISED